MADGYEALYARMLGLKEDSQDPDEGTDPSADESAPVPLRAVRG
jgi:hypothetical protein